MEAFNWDAYYETGLELIDQQHRRLVELINSLGDSLIGDAAEADLEETFRQLAEYTQFHFSDEQRMMHAAGLDAGYLEKHDHHHRDFIAQIASMWTSRFSTPNAVGTLHQYLCAWLGFHILGEDQFMARQAAYVREGMSAAQAYEQATSSRDPSTRALLRAMTNLYRLLSAQNRELVRANQNLEQRVEERTQQLAQANSELSALNTKLQGLAETDGLLEIANRRHFSDRLLAEWRRARRERQLMSLLMIDVDYFKRYNDHYGHQAGDDCLRAVARAAVQSINRGGDLVARYGGEELVVLLPNTPLDGARHVAQQILAEIRKLDIAHAGSQVASHVTVSIGVATLLPDGERDPSELIAAADRALYAAKNNGRNRIELASELASG